MSVGIAIAMGTVPLARAVSPGAEPWWQPGVLVVGGVFLLFGLWALVTSKEGSQSVARVADSCSDPIVTAVIDGESLRMSLFDPDAADGAPILSLRVGMHVANTHPSESAVVLGARLETPVFDDNSVMPDGAGWSGIVWQPSAGAAPIEITPRDNRYVMCQFDGHPLRDANGWKRHEAVKAVVILVDQFGREQSAASVRWSSPREKYFRS
jgi:hypothetical protein